MPLMIDLTNAGSASAVARTRGRSTALAWNQGGFALASVREPPVGADGLPAAAGAHRTPGVNPPPAPHARGGPQSGQGPEVRLAT